MSRIDTRLWLAFAALTLGSAVEAADPVTIKVGYQTWYSGTASAIVIRDRELWKKYMPPGVQVEFEVALQGPIIINNMMADKQQIGYMGDMPAMVATTKEANADIRMVALTSFSEGQVCHLLAVRSDAPKFKSPEEAVKWLDGKIVAAPKGGCTDLFFRTVMQKSGIKPKEYQHASVEVIATSFRSKRIDAAVIPDAPMSRIGDLVGDGIARIAVTGAGKYSLPDASILVMRKDFMDRHPAIAKAWLRMEMDVQKQFLLDPKQWEAVAQMAAKQNPGFTARQWWFALFGRIPAEQGGSDVRQSFPFVFDDRARTKVADGFKFLREIQVINVDKPRQGAVDDALAREVLKEAGVTAPLGSIRGLPLAQAPK